MKIIRDFFALILCALNLLAGIYICGVMLYIILYILYLIAQVSIIGAGFIIAILVYIITCILSEKIMENK